MIRTRRSALLHVPIATALALVPACFHRGAPRPSVPTSAARPSAATVAPPASSVSGVSLRAWASNHRPASSAAEDCGIRESHTDVSAAEWRGQEGPEPSVCYSAVGCPAQAAVTVARCEPSTEPLVDIEDFVADQTRWREGVPIRLRGRMFVDDPHHRQGFSFPTRLRRPEKPDCFPDWHRSLAMQVLAGDQCFGVTAAGSAVTPPMICTGDLSRSCCDHLPLGELLVASGTLHVAEQLGTHSATLFLANVCRE